MKNRTTINKVAFQNQLVKAVLAADERLTFKHFNNRRYFFYYTNTNQITVLLELRVHLAKKYIAAIVHSKSNLNETTYLIKHPHYHSGFMDLKSYGNYPFESAYEVLIQDAVEKIHASLVATVADHTTEIILSRQGINLGMKYDIGDDVEPFYFPSIYSYLDLRANKNEQLKTIYIDLFKALDMANSGVPDYRIKYVLLSIIQVVLAKKKIPFTNPVH